MLRVAVRLPATSGRIGDYVADVTALEAAGADSIWLDASGATSAEPWMLLGAIAAVTHRVRLGVQAALTEGLPDTISSLARMTGGRVVVGVPFRHDSKALVELKSRSAATPPWLLVMCSTRREAEAAAQVAGGVILAGAGPEVRALRSGPMPSGDLEIWIESQVAADRAGWAGMVSALEAAGATGIMVPWEPRIIDLLRNAGEPDDRTDLLIATG